MTQQLYGATHASRRAGIAVSTLRYYVKRQVVTPLTDSNGRALFTDDDINAIRRHRETGHGRK